VLLVVRVSAQGQAESVQVRQSSGFERLDEAAMAAVRQWRFVPARRGEEPIAASVLVPLVFKLE
jgi:protein TonB